MIGCLFAAVWGVILLIELNRGTTGVHGILLFKFTTHLTLVSRPLQPQPASTEGIGAANKSASKSEGLGRNLSRKRAILVN